MVEQTFFITSHKYSVKWQLRLCIILSAPSWTLLYLDIFHLPVYKAGDIRGTAPLATTAKWREWKTELFIKLFLLSALLNWNHLILTAPVLSSSPYHVLKPFWAHIPAKNDEFPLWFIFHHCTKNLLYKDTMSVLAFIFLRKLDYLKMFC